MAYTRKMDLTFVRRRPGRPKRRVPRVQKWREHSVKTTVSLPKHVLHEVEMLKNLYPVHNRKSRNRYYAEALQVMVEFLDRTVPTPEFKPISAGERERLFLYVKKDLWRRVEGLADMYRLTVSEFLSRYFAFLLNQQRNKVNWANRYRDHSTHIEFIEEEEAA